MEQTNRQMTQVEIDELWKRFIATGSIEIKNKLVMLYVPLVNRIVARIAPMYGMYSSFDDMLGYGVLGLIDAVEKFAPERQIKFEIYAARRIKGEIIDSMRKQDWAPASLRSRIKQIGNAYEEMEKTTPNEVSDEAVAQSLGLDVTQVRTALEKAYMFNAVRFESLIGNAPGSSGLAYENVMPSDESHRPDRRLEEKEFKLALAGAINKLTDNERKIVSLYYYEELMLKDIADILGISPARVSQLHSRALMKLKNALSDYDALENDAVE